MCIFHWPLAAGALLAFSGAAWGDDSRRFVAEEDNFSVVIPGRVTTNQIGPGARQYSCVVRNGATDQTQYLITVGKAPDGVDPMARMQAGRDNVIKRLRQDSPDLTLLWSVPLRCSGYPGLQYSFVYNRIKNDGLGGGFDLPSGSDARLIRAGDRMYTLVVDRFIYDGLWKLASGYKDTPETSRQFFASFRLLKNVSVPVATEKESILGEWSAPRQKKGPAQDAPADKVPDPDYVFRDNGEVVMLGFLKGTYQTNDDREPREIELTFEMPAKNTRKGIYKFSDGRLQLCLGEEGASSRPTQFEETSKQSLQNLIRPGDPLLTEGD